MIDKYLISFLEDYFKDETKLRGLITYTNGNIQRIDWDQIDAVIRGPDEFKDDVYDMISNYDVDTECIVFIANNDTQYLLKLQRL